MKKTIAFLSLLLISLPVFAETPNPSKVYSVSENAQTAKADGLEKVTVAVATCKSGDSGNAVADTALVVNPIDNSDLKFTRKGTVESGGTACGAVTKPFDITSAKAGEYNVAFEVSDSSEKVLATLSTSIRFVSVEVTPTPEPSVTPKATPTPTVRPKPTEYAMDYLKTPRIEKVMVGEKEYSLYEFEALTVKPESELTFVGTAEPKTKLSIFLYPEQYFGKANVSDEGEWQYTFSQKMEPGDHQVEAKIADSDGNVSKRVRAKFRVEGPVQTQNAQAERKYGSNIAFWIFTVLFLASVSGAGFYIYKRRKNKNAPDKKDIGPDEAGKRGQEDVEGESNNDGPEELGDQENS